MKKNEVTIRSSAAEYLTFVASTGDSSESVEMRYEDENIWLSQKMMAVLYDVDVRTINYHIKKIFEDSELQEDSVIRKFRITASDGKNYNTSHYSLQMIIAVGFKANSERADSKKEHMGLTVWQDAPDGKIKKSDVTIAKNYLTEFEMTQLNRMVTSYLDFAENMAIRKIPLTMQDWEQRLNGFIEMFQYGLLKDAGKVTAEIAKIHAETEFEKYRIVQDRLFMSDFDKFMLELENEEILD